MATITCLTWNIEHFGPSKVVDQKESLWRANAKALFKTIRDTIRLFQVNLAVFHEVSPSTSEWVEFCLRHELNSNGVTGWRSARVESNKSDVYLVLWREGQGFRASVDGNGELVTGLVTHSATGGALQFHGSKTPTGGRRPGYMLFETTDRMPANPEVHFSFLFYHAMFNKTQGQVGLNSIAQAAELTTVAVPGLGGTNVSAAIIAGDFNVDIVSMPAAYGALVGLPATPAVDQNMGVVARSTLSSVTPSHGMGHESTVDYRANAYDNIFFYNPTTAPVNNQVIDMLDELGNWNGASGRLWQCAQHFKTEAIELGELIRFLPPVDLDDAWHVYIGAISNHLPVTGRVTI